MHNPTDQFSFSFKHHVIDNSHYRILDHKYDNDVFFLTLWTFVGSCNKTNKLHQASTEMHCYQSEIITWEYYLLHSLSDNENHLKVITKKNETNYLHYHSQRKRVPTILAFHLALERMYTPCIWILEANSCLNNSTSWDMDCVDYLHMRNIQKLSIHRFNKQLE